MRSISPHMAALIERLNQPAGLWERLSESRHDVGILNQIADAGEPAAVIHVAPFLLAEQREVARAAAMAMSKLLATISPAEFARIDAAMRERSLFSSGRYLHDWQRLSPPGLDRLEALAAPPTLLLGMASFHNSGYVREEAIRRLDQSTNGSELPFLLIRLNDWVENVREAATKAVHSRLIPLYAHRFVASLPLIARLEQAGRGDHRPLLGEIRALLKRAECRDALFEGTRSTDRFVRRMSFQLTIEAEGANIVEIIERALGDEDLVVRLWAARRVASLPEEDAIANLLRRMKRDRLMPVRREALRTIVRRFPERAAVELRSALMDSHVSIREEARYLSKTVEPVDFASFYRQALAAAVESELDAAIGGLGETGALDDDKLVLPYLSHRRSRVRKAAIRALSRLNVNAHIEVLVSALTDESPRVSREAQKALAGRMRLAGGVRLWEIFVASRLRHVRAHALALLADLNKWDSIPYLIKAASDADEEIAARGRLYVERWLREFNRGFSAPTPEQLRRFKNALNDGGGILDEGLQGRLLFSMKGF